MQAAEKGRLDWLAQLAVLKVVLRSAGVMSGEQCATAPGMHQKLILYADNWDTALEVSCTLHFFILFL